MTAARSVQPATSAFTQVLLPDGRRLAYLDLGDPAGVPCFFFHGTPGSRVWGETLDDAAARVGVRLLSLDRPGYGRSDPQPDRRMTDWPLDVASVADSLDIHRFAVMGFSGGGAHALACGAALPERLTTCVVLAGVPPADTPGWREGMGGPFRLIHWLGVRNPITLWPLFGVLVWLSRHPGIAAKLEGENVDSFINELPGMTQLLRRNDAEAFRQGVRHSIDDYVLNIRDWGFRPEDVRAPVEYWQGDADPNVSAAAVQRFVARLPDCTLHLCPEEGHNAYFRHADEIMRHVATAGSGPASRRRSRDI